MQNLIPYFETEKGILYCGDAKEVLKELADNSVKMCVTSPPYWTLRDYDHPNQLGQETTFKEYVENLVEFFDEVKRILTKDGSLWVNIGDTYYGGLKGSGGSGKQSGKQLTNHGSYLPNAKVFRTGELPNKSLCNIPARFAIVMQDSGWILRNDIIWHKPNSFVTSAKDRFTHDYEHFYFFTKNKKYFFNQQFEAFSNSTEWNPIRHNGDSDYDNGTGQSTHRARNMQPNEKGRNKRCIWSINTQPIYGLKHFAKFPEKLIETPILAGTNEGDIVLDLFMGSGTTALVAERLGRKWCGIEINEKYCKIIKDRINGKEKI